MARVLKERIFVDIPDNYVTNYQGTRELAAYLKEHQEVLIEILRFSVLLYQVPSLKGNSQRFERAEIQETFIGDVLRRKTGLEVDCVGTDQKGYDLYINDFGGITLSVKNTCSKLSGGLSLQSFRANNINPDLCPFDCMLITSLSRSKSHTSSISLFSREAIKKCIVSEPVELKCFPPIQYSLVYEEDKNVYTLPTETGNLLEVYREKYLKGVIRILKK